MLKVEDLPKKVSYSAAAAIRICYSHAVSAHCLPFPSSSCCTPPPHCAATHPPPIPTPQAVFCRCWRSEKFPFCDGKHVAHNKVGTMWEQSQAF
jgi:hypothetical protein